MTGAQADGARFRGSTAWARNLATPVRDYLRTETGGAAVLLAAVVAALAWANAAPGAYESAWSTELSLRLGGAALHQDLRHWVNDGLMVFFFFVVGLEAKRELDMGDLRERRRIAIPVVAALGGMTAPILIYLAFNAGGPGAGGWGAAMSTDTAFARRPRARHRADPLVFASSRPPSSRARRGSASSRRSRPTSGSSTACTRGRATPSCRCSRSPTPAS